MAKHTLTGHFLILRMEGVNGLINPIRSSRLQMFQMFHISVLKNVANFKGKRLCWSLFLIKFQLYRNETPTQVFFFEIWEVFQNIFFRWLLLFNADETSLSFKVNDFVGNKFR